MTSAELLASSGLARRLATRQKLLGAARGLFVTEGYHATRPQDITRAAGVGHGTFYLHFTDKQACFLAFVEEATAELNEVVASHVGETHGIEARIRAILTAIHVFSNRHPGVLNAAMTDLSVIAANDAPAERVSDRWAQQWAELLRPSAQAGDIDGDSDLLLIGHAIVGAINEAANYAFRTAGQDAVRHAAMLDDLARFLTRGLGKRQSKPA
jgi:AcrR family transcriptional regulator